METNESLAEIEETAARWLLRREGARWNTSDQAELDEWLEGSTSHCVSFMRLGRVWREVGRLKMPDTELPHDTTPPRDGTRPVQSWRSRAEHLGIAAALLLTVALALTAYLHRSQRFSTPVGGLSTVHTHDGSVITLNTDTEILVKLSNTERRIELVRGEAFFDVASSPTRPFTVYVGHEQIIALGTQFSVWAKPDMLHVTVIDGSVRVVASPGPLSPKIQATSSRNLGKGTHTDLVQTDSAVLSAGAVADVRGAEIAVRHQTVAGIEAALTWRTGEIDLDLVSLPEAIKEFNRYHTRKIAMGDSSLETVTIAARFRVGDVDRFLDVLRGWGIHSEVQDDVIVLTRAPSKKLSH